MRLITICSQHRFVQSWIDKREVQSEKANLTILFDRYVPPCLDCLKHRFKKITPIADNSMVQSLCYLLEVLLTPENTPPDSPKDLYEMYFVFAAVWAFGGAMFQDQVCTHTHTHTHVRTHTHMHACTHTYTYTHSLILSNTWWFAQFSSVGWLSCWVLKMVANWVQDSQVPSTRNCVWLLH